MVDVLDPYALQRENEKLRAMNSMMAKALADREAYSVRPACQVSADPLLVAENARLRKVLGDDPITPGE